MSGRNKCKGTPCNLLIATATFGGIGLRLFLIWVKNCGLLIPTALQNSAPLLYLLMISSNMPILKHSFNFNVKHSPIFYSENSAYAEQMKPIPDDDKEHQELADRLREAINSMPRGIKSEIARICDVAPQAVTGWITTGRIDKVNLLIVSNKTGYNINYLITGKGPKLAVHTDKNVISEKTNSDKISIKSKPSSDSIFELLRIPVLRREQALNWKLFVDKFNNGTDKEMMFFSVSEMPTTENSFGFIVTGDAMSPRLNEGDRVKIEPDMMPTNGNFVLAEIAGDTVIRKFVNEAGDTRLVAINDDYLPKNSADCRIIGVVTHKVPKPEPLI